MKILSQKISRRRGKISRRCRKDVEKMEEISREDGGTLLLSLEFMDWHLQWENGF